MNGWAMSEKTGAPGASTICFGLDRATDEKSLAAFLQRFANEALLEQLIPRLTDQEIDAAVEVLSALLRQHLSEREYHRLFLQD
jgi:TorA maturation chaperone TorD